MNGKWFIRGALILALLALSACQQNTTAVLTFGGDVMLARDGAPLFVDNPWGDASQYLDDLKSKFPDSFFLVNLESPFSQDGQANENLLGGYNLCAGAEQVAVLETGGVNLVSLANNHAFDCAKNGTTETHQILNNVSILAAGQDNAPTFFDANGLHIGVIAAEDVTAAVDTKKLMEQIGNARADCDFLIVSMHWGNEYQSGADRRQMELAQQIANAGADVLWGHHPHVLQPITWVESEQNGHRMLVMFSLGNLLSDQSMSADTQRTALVTLTVSGREITGISVKPLIMDTYVRQLRFATGEETTAILDRLQIESLENVRVVIP
jgi:poly-gamma-glutamate synthesis protein (capsule biosynthesis protein)